MKEKKVLFVTPFFHCEECIRICDIIETGIQNEFNKHQDYSLQVTRSSSMDTLSDEIISTDFCVWVIPAGSILQIQNFTRDLEKAIDNDEKKLDIRVRGKLSSIIAVPVSNNRPFTVETPVDLEESRILLQKFQNFLMNLGFLLVFLRDYPLQPTYLFQVAENVGDEPNSIPVTEITTNLPVSSNNIASLLDNKIEIFFFINVSIYHLQTQKFLFLELKFFLTENSPFQQISQFFQLCNFFLLF